MSQKPELTVDERGLARLPLAPYRKINNLWEAHLRTEFDAHSADEAITTMLDESLVNQVPVMIGGDGKKELYDFYAKYFLPQIPPDMQMVTVLRTIGQGRLVEEMVARLTHSIRMDWMLPGIPPTGKRVEVALIVVVEFDGDKLAHEHLYWDQASVLVQIGLLQPGRLPVVGAEAARSLLDQSVRLNDLIRRAKAKPQDGAGAHLRSVPRSSYNDAA